MTRPALLPEAARKATRTSPVVGDRSSEEPKVAEHDSPMSPRRGDRPDRRAERNLAASHDRIPSQKALFEIPRPRPMCWAVDGRNFNLGFAPDQRSIMDILGTRDNRKLIETRPPGSETEKIGA